ncbi:MAG: hypothetical protein ACOZNI_36120 [Myxococcota bacterium]
MLACVAVALAVGPPLWGEVGAPKHYEVTHAYEWLADGTLALGWRYHGGEVRVTESPDGVKWTDATGWMTTDTWTDPTPSRRYRLLWRAAPGGEILPSDVLWVGPRGDGPAWYGSYGLEHGITTENVPVLWETRRRYVKLVWIAAEGGGEYRLERSLDEETWTVVADWFRGYESAEDHAPVLDRPCWYRVRWRDEAGFEVHPDRAASFKVRPP